MAQAEVEDLCGIKPPPRGRPPPPRERERQTPRSIEHRLLEIVIQHPEWAARVPMELIDRGRIEGAALSAIADAVDHGELPAGKFSLMIEFFRGTEFEELISTVAPHFAENKTDAETHEAIFNDSVSALRVQTLDKEMKARKHDLTPDEWRELLARKAQAQKNPATE
jgi:DNA primase